jgi:hypothetical protein
MNRVTYTKIFLNSSKLSTDDANIKKYSSDWWYNTRDKKEGGLRLTEAGRDFLKNNLELTLFRIKFPPDVNIYKTNILIHLDNFITCPYYLTKKYIEVTDDRKAMEISLFSGDIERYGLIKAIERQKNI